MSEPAQVISRDGHRGSISPAPEASASQVSVRFEDGRSALVPVELLERAADGTYRLSADRGDLIDDIGSRPIVVPVVEETLEIEKQRVTTGTVRVHKRVHTHDELIDETTTRDEVSIERVPIGQILAEPPEPRREGETLIIPVLEEVLVVEKRLMLKEEVRITRRRVEEHRPQHASLRREEVIVDRIPAEGDADAGSGATEA